MKVQKEKVSKKTETKEKAPMREKVKKNYWNLKSGLTLAGIGLIILIPTTIWLTIQLLAAKDLATILPSDNLIIVAELEESELNEDLKVKYPQLAQSWSSDLGLLLGFDLEKTQAWRGEKLGFAFYQNQEAAGFSPTLEEILDPEVAVDLLADSSFDWILFLETKSKGKAKDYLASINSSESNIEGMTIYKPANRPSKCALLEGYLICTNLNSNLLTQIDQGSINPTLSETSNYQQLRAQLPSKTSALVYLNPEKLAPVLDSKLEKIYLPLVLEDLEAFAFSIKQNKLAVEITGFALKKTPQGEELAQGEELDNEVLSILPQRTEAFAHIKNSQEAIESVLNEMIADQEDFNTYTLGKIRARLQEVFSQDLSIEQDLLPILENDLIIGSTDNKEFFLLLTGSDGEFLEAKRQKLAEGFEKMANDAVAQVLEQELEDGTVIEEVFPVYESVEKESGEFLTGNYTSVAMLDQTQSLGLTFARIDNYLILTTNTSLAKEIMQKVDLPLDRRENSSLIQNYNLQTYSQNSESFGFNQSWLQGLLASQEEETSFLTTFIDSVNLILGKTNRFPDSFRIDLKLVF